MIMTNEQMQIKLNEINKKKEPSIGMGMAENALELFFKSGLQSSNHEYVNAIQDTLEDMVSAGLTIKDLASRPDFISEMLSAVSQYKEFGDSQLLNSVNSLELSIQAGAMTNAEYQEEMDNRRNSQRYDDGYEPKVSNVDGKVYYVNKHTNDILSEEAYRSTEDIAPDALGWKEDSYEQANPYSGIASPAHTGSGVQSIKTEGEG